MCSKHQPVTLLLIEDDDVDVMTIEREFAKKSIGNQIIRACDGQEALELLQNNMVPSPYVILLDLNMPRMNGPEFLTQVRADPTLSNSVVFVLTTSIDEQDIESLFNKQIAGYFVKESGTDFSDVINVLDSYWKTSYLPS